MQGHLLAAEFRHATWFFGEHLEHTLDWERRLGLVHTIVDSPQGFANCVPCVWDVTNPRLAIVRLHGRNKETWNKKGLAASSARFDYQYSREELAAMLPEIRHLATQARSVHVVFNTNYQDQGQVGGRMLMDLLRDTKVVAITSDDLYTSITLEEQNPLVGTSRLMLMTGTKDNQLKQWTVTDPQGYDTTVAVYNLDTTKKPDPGMFKIDYTNYSNPNN